MTADHATGDHAAGDHSTGDQETSDEETGALIELLALPEMGPARLGRLLAAHGSAAATLDAVGADAVDDSVDLRRSGEGRRTLLTEWRRAARTADPVAAVARHRAAGVTILHPSDAAWPRAFVDDPEPPDLLFVQGDVGLLNRVGVAIVGTRRCTAGGMSVARELGRDLAAAGVAVISGLAMGIDGAAHRGALDAAGPTVAVVATGHDVVYPRQHRDLWADVARVGVVVSEAPLGTPPTRWRFPARNRLLAAMAAVVVVVESGTSGGSMRTVESAMVRDTDVMAVPGPVRAPTSTGPNQLLADGCGVVRDATDVLVALGSRVPRADTVALLDPRERYRHVDATPDDRGGPGGPGADAVAALISWPPISLDRLVVASGLPFAEVARRVTMLEVRGEVERVAQGYQRCVR